VQGPHTRRCNTEEHIPLLRVVRRTRDGMHQLDRHKRAGEPHPGAWRRTLASGGASGRNGPPPSHGRGHKFESCIAHSRNPCSAGIFLHTEVARSAPRRRNTREMRAIRVSDSSERFELGDSGVHAVAPLPQPVLDLLLRRERVTGAGRPEEGTRPPLSQTIRVADAQGA
jgi:hypothetical protein